MSKIYIGFDPRPAEAQAYAVARKSIRRYSKIKIKGVILKDLIACGLYDRPTDRRDGVMWDRISGAPMSTEFAISRFLVPRLARSGWALFVVGDVLARADVGELFAMADPSKACMVVKHNYTPVGKTKMDGQIQTAYPRKNWSSVVLWNCDHRGAQYLTPGIVNTMRGLWLHQFSWLDDSDIGELDPCWNHLVGDYPPNAEAKLVHFTNGCPNMDRFERCEYADEWWDAVYRWAV